MIHVTPRSSSGQAESCFTSASLIAPGPLFQQPPRTREADARYQPVWLCLVSGHLDQPVSYLGFNMALLSLPAAWQTQKDKSTGPRIKIILCPILGSAVLGRPTRQAKDLCSLIPPAGFQAKVPYLYRDTFLQVAAVCVLHIEKRNVISCLCYTIYRVNTNTGSTASSAGDLSILLTHLLLLE